LRLIDEKVLSCGIARSEKRTYWVDDEGVWDSAADDRGEPVGKPKLVRRHGLRLAPEYVYYLSADGDVWRALHKSAARSTIRGRVPMPKLLPWKGPTLPHGESAVTMFMFGYWGWGSETKLLLELTAAVERDRGFGPPCFVDVRISRSVRAAGFRERAFEELAGPDRYRWMPALGNKRVAEHESGIAIADPHAAEKLLDLALERARRDQRLIFFCACEFPGSSQAPLCHRRVVGDLLLAVAKRRRVPLRLGEWPGGPPVDIDVEVPLDDLFKLRDTTTALKTDLPPEALAAMPWGSRVTARSGEFGYPFVSGPARVSRGRLVLAKLLFGVENLAKAWGEDDRELGLGWPE
jgi:hypothetical protein